MKAATILGIRHHSMLGVIAFAYQGITYTTRDKMIDLGPLQATVDTKQTIPLTPLWGEGESTWYRVLWRDMVGFRHGCVGAGSVR